MGMKSWYIQLKFLISPRQTHYYGLQTETTLGIFSKCPYKIQWHMKMPQYNHFICHFYCHFSVFSHILL